VKTENPSACVTVNCELRKSAITPIACKYTSIVQGINKSNHPLQNPLLLVTEPPDTGQYFCRDIDTYKEYGICMNI
jgi:hypothetical protein